MEIEHIKNVSYDQSVSETVESDRVGERSGSLMMKKVHEEGGASHRPHLGGRQGDFPHWSSRLKPMSEKPFHDAGTQRGHNLHMMLMREAFLSSPQ